MRAAVLIAVLCLLVAGCRHAEESTFTIGVIADCAGPFGGFFEPMLAGAQLPLLERGGTSVGRVPSRGVLGPVVGGRRVELLVGCQDTKALMLDDARRLVERDHVDAVVGPLGPTAGLALREYARRHPEVAFVSDPSQAPELTLDDPAPNVFRFSADAAQLVGGLGTYAYRTLGWRTAVTVGTDAPYEWAQVAGFLAEFCALGGRIVDRLWAPLYQPDLAPLAPDADQARADGVFVAGGLSAPLGFLQAYARTHADLDRRLVAVGFVLLDQAVLSQLGARIDGVVGGSSQPFSPTAGMRRYVRSFTRAFPALPEAAALNLIVLPYYTAVAAVLEALDRAGDGGSFMDELSSVRLDAPTGPVRLDERRQAVVQAYLASVARRDGRTTYRPVRVVPGIEQTYGGRLTAADPPTRTGPACRAGSPPPWATPRP